LKKRGVGVSYLTAFILIFGICLWTAQSFGNNVLSDCQLGLYWTSNWFQFESLFQESAFTLGLLFLLWLVQAVNGSARNRTAETAAQGVLILAMAISMISLKAYLFPFAPPTQAQVYAAIDYYHPIPDVLVEERAAPPLSYDDAPDVEFRENPVNDPRIDKQLSEIFTSRSSPTVADMERLHNCVAEQKRAAAQWEVDRKIIQDFEREKELLVNPSRPRDWRDDLDS
jgi:hypothetical protein